MGKAHERRSVGAETPSEFFWRSLQNDSPGLLPLEEGIYKMPGSLGLRPECGGDGGGNENKASRE